VGDISVGENQPHLIIWNREVAPILQFNHKRRRFLERASGSKRQRTEQLVEELVTAEKMDNHHLYFWLVSYHADDFCGLRVANERT
jgi:hypothetical protein